METATTASQKTDQFDLAQFITDKFVAQLEQGIVPWHTNKPDIFLPINLVTKEHYRGINTLLLLMAGFDQNLFLSFDEVHNLGGKVKAGSKGVNVLRWTKPKDEQRNAPAGEHKKLFMKQYTVFNIEQCEIPEKAMMNLAKPPIVTKPELITKCMPKCPKIEYKTGEAHYDVVEDIIAIPKPKNKKNEALHYASLFHLLIHSTGHDSRLMRKGVAEMEELSGRKMYSREEAVAAIGACFLSVHTGIAPCYPSDPEYAKGWCEVLKENKWLIFNVTRDAQKAFDYILDVKHAVRQSE